MTTKEVSVIISERERKLLKLLHQIGYGRITLYLEAGQPVRIEEALKSIKL